MKTFNQLYNLLEDTEDDAFSKGFDIYNTLTNLPIYRCVIGYHNWGYNKTARRFIRPIMYMFETTILGLMDEFTEQAIEDGIEVRVYVFEGDNIIKMDVDEFKAYLVQMVHNNKIARLAFVDPKKLPSRYSEERNGMFVSKDHDQLIKHQLKLSPDADVYYYRHQNSPSLKSEKGVILQNGTAKLLTDKELYAPIVAKYEGLYFRFTCDNILHSHIAADHTHLLLTGKQIAYIVDNVINNRKTVQLDVKDLRSDKIIPITYSLFGHD